MAPLERAQKTGPEKGMVKPNLPDAYNNKKKVYAIGSLLRNCPPNFLKNVK